MATHHDMQRFARGEPIAVEVGDIERELSALWQQASSAGGASPEGTASGAVSRAALWNVVIPSNGPSGLAATKQLVDELAPTLPTRTITLCLDDATPAGRARRGIQASIENNVVSHPGGGRMVYSEEIILTGPPDAEAHFGALVRGLGVPGVPTATFWLDAGLPESLLLRELLPISERLVLDTTCCLRPDQLFAFERLATRAHPLPIADLGWLRVGGLRSLFAGLFDPPVGGEPLARCNRLMVRHRGGSDSTALLMVAWIGIRLGWRPLRCAQSSDGGLRFDFARGDASGNAATVAAHLAPSEGACGKSGILGLEIWTGDDRFGIRRTAIDQTLIESPVAPPRTVKIDSPSEAELAVAALGPRGRDPLFADCLRYARQLWALEPSTNVSRR
jgi:glucose-6-phosphate dehydrogenase assembly protein OpcA